jgi:outer membrane protein OmpA-like peptidoglycan-associated protein
VRLTALAALSMTALTLAMVTACHRDAPVGSASDRPPSAEPPPDTSGLLAAPLDGAHEVRRISAALDSVPAGDANLRPDSVDAMLVDSAAPSRVADVGAGTAAPDPRLPSETGIPVAAGLRLTSVHHYPDGDREKVVSLIDVSAGGVEYAWHFQAEQGQPPASRETFSRIVSAADLARAPRLNQIFQSGRHESTPGYTAMSLSRAVYAEIRRGAATHFSITDLDHSTLGAGAGAVGEKLGGQLGGMVQAITTPRVTLHGTLTPVAAAPESLAVLLDGRRVRLPALHLRGAFTYDDKNVGGDFWVLADSADPLILREAGDGEDLRIVRIDRPLSSAVEGQLAGASCRAELPGIYFAFASAELEPESDAALAGVARMLAGHPDWSLTIEGHTDSIGGAASNQALSERRAEAVRAALVSRYAVAASRLTARGFGATRPLESNATVEGRARNRRVEAARPCGP